MSREIHLVAYPDGEIRADHFRVVEVDTPAPAPGEVLVRNLWTSVDPGMRLRLAAAGPAGYFAPFALDAPLDGIMTVGEVVEARAAGFAPGDIVWHAAGWREFATVRAGEPALRGLGTLKKLDCSLAPPEAYLGPPGGACAPSWGSRPPSTISGLRSPSSFARSRRTAATCTSTTSAASTWRRRSPPCAATAAPRCAEPCRTTRARPGARATSSRPPRTT